MENAQPTSRYQSNALRWYCGFESVRGRFGPPLLHAHLVPDDERQPRLVPSCPKVRAAVGDRHSTVWAMRSGQRAGSGSEPEDPNVQREKVRCVIPLGATSDVTP
jgi:hypothetical protein